MQEPVPEPSYLARFNAAAAKNGTSCAAEAIRDLNETLKHPVTAALRKIMHAHPQDPIRFLASCLKQDNEAKYVVDRKTLVMEELGNVEIMLQRASQRPSGCCNLSLAQFNISGMQCPSFQELLQEIERVSAANPACSQISVVIKENDPRQDLVFIQGIPYFANLGALIRERGLELKKKDTVSSLLLRSASKLGKAHTIQDVASSSNAVKKPVKYSFIQSPQTDPFQAIDLIDALIGLPSQPKKAPAASGAPDAGTNASEAARKPETTLQPIIIVSYHSDESALRQLLTIAITTAHPIVELEEMKAVVTLRESSLLARRKQSFGVHVDYWKQVRIGREERDQRREDKEELRLRKEQTLLTGVASNTIDPAQAELLKYDGTGVAERLKKAAAVRYHRRQREDGVFLDVCRWHRDQSAIRIQNMWRGAKSRNAWKAAVAKEFAAKEIAGWKDPDGSPRHRQLTNIDAPVLLQRALRSLQDVHGEKYVNSIQLVKKGFTRNIPLWVPKKTKLPRAFEEDESSEEESWEKIEVDLPNIPSAKRSKDFNPFAILKNAVKQAGYAALDNAVFDATHFPGISAIQHRAYNSVMDSVMLLVHTAFVELRHRGQALSESTFTNYFNRYFSEMHAWRMVPNFVALATVPLAGTTSRSGPTEPLQDRYLCLSDAPERPPWGKFDVAASTLAEARWVKQVAKNVFAVLDASDLSRLKGMVQLLGQSDAHITWISTTSQPYCYVHGKSFVACERRRDQVTPGHGLPNSIADVAIHNPVGSTPSEPSVDGRSRTPSVCNPSQPGSPVPTVSISQEFNPSLFTVFGVSMRDFEQKLRMELIHFAETIGVIRYLDMVSPDGGVTPQGVNTADLTLDLAQGLYYGHYFTECMKAPVLERKELVLFPRVASIAAKNEAEGTSGNDLTKDTRRISQNLAASAGAHSMSGASSMNSKSGRYRRSQSRSGPAESGERSNSQTGSGRDLNDGKSPSTTSLVPNEHHSSQFRSVAHGIIQTPTAVVDSVFHEEQRGEGTFLRMPMMDVGGRTWLGFLDQFLSQCFAAIKAKHVLAVAVSDSSSMFYACCAALLAPSIDSNAPESPLFRSKVDPFDDSLVSHFIEQLGQEPGMRAKAVVDDILDHAFGGQNFTAAIMTFKESAESARTHKGVRDNIVFAYQRLERYCWLIMLANFVMSTNLAGVNEMPSFAQWAASKRNASALKALDELDLWAAEPRKCPDPCNRAYSSIAKRWETRSEAKQML
jgi:hypothetical protein